MKVVAILVFTSLFPLFSIGQSILFIDDNDNITDNSDTLLQSLQNTIYSTFDYYDAVDSSATPSLQLLSSYDLVIWYASTDGVGLKFWSEGTTGNQALKDYLNTGGRLWVVGSDLLFSGGYFTPHNFVSGDFAYDFMGIQSYNNQSYGDDGSLGVAEVNAIAGAPGSLPATLNWIFSTIWWVDGVTARSGGINMYEMGPSGYVLHEEVTMVHFRDGQTTNTMSTFFDPALISGFGTRSDFMEKSISYLLNFDLGVSKNQNSGFEVYPNPSSDLITVKFDLGFETSAYTILSSTGSKVFEGNIINNTIDISNLDMGIYFLSIDGNTVRIVKY